MRKYKYFNLPHHDISFKIENCTVKVPELKTWKTIGDLTMIECSRKVILTAV